MITDSAHASEVHTKRLDNRFFAKPTTPPSTSPDPIEPTETTEPTVPVQDIPSTSIPIPVDDIQQQDSPISSEVVAKIKQRDSNSSKWLYIVGGIGGLIVILVIVYASFRAFGNKSESKDITGEGDDDKQEKRDSNVE